MKMDFADAMRAATKLTRAQKLMEATRVIQSALLLGRGRGQTEPEDEQAVEVRAIEPLTIDIVPNVAPTVTLPLGDVAATLGRARLPSFGLDGLAPIKPRKPLEIPDGAQYLSRCLRCRKAELQALRSEPATRGEAPIGRHAAWRHARPR